MSRATAPHRASSRGYTLVEVMVALAILGVGIMGILSMENAAITSNHRAQEMTIATNIARRWQERLWADALLWNSPSSRTGISDLGTDTQYLCPVVGCAGGAAQSLQWLVPTPAAGSLDSAAYDAFGNEVPLGSPQTYFCVNTRISWLRADTSARMGLVRAEVRVWWYREGATRNPSYASCGTGGALQTMGTDIAHLQFVYAASSLTGNPL
jgi:prepilin-type N-terminal cleavage/methylation domain-containing protein